MKMRTFAEILRLVGRTAMIGTFRSKRGQQTKNSAFP
jgi:hypothetical protein